MEKLKNIAYNTKYNILKYLEGYGKGRLAKANHRVFILGKQITIPFSNGAEVQKEIY
jgi:hypothetical protein